MTEQTACKVPQIRFKGFDGEWEIRILGDEPGEIIAGGDVEKHKLCERGKYPVLANALQNQGILGFYKDDFRVKAPAVTVTGRGDVGHAAVRETNFTPVVRLLSVKSSHNVYFLKESINNHKVLVESTGVPQLTVPQFSKYRIWFPGTIREENQIGEYFRELDSLIGLHQRKHDKLVTLKKAMLQKMFPQPGTTTPEIRFKGFSADWVVKKIGELGEVVTGSTPSTQNPNFYSENGIPWVTPTDIENNITLNAAKHLSASGAQVARVVPMNTILITCIASIGKNTLLGTRGSFNQQINGVVPFKEKHDPYFLFTASILWSQKMKASAASGTMQIVNKSEFSEVKTQTPLIEEQQKIGTYFRTLDVLIAKHATQLKKLQQLKSACLEKMFV